MMDGEPSPDVRRVSIEKQPVDECAADEDDATEATHSAFQQLPDEIIQQILRLTDPSSFASLILLNSKWRNASQQAHLYAHQLSHCPSYATSHRGRAPEVREDSLPDLKRLFAHEVKRNLFTPYLRPAKTIIKLISNSISSSSCPGGEGLQFNASPKGHHLLAYNSSRIYIIDTRESEVAVKRELKILRRPAATYIKDDGSLLAVLLTDMQVDIYDLTCSPPRRTQSLILDHSPRAIALSPDGSVLAAAYEGGIEVSSLNPGALPTDRRAVKCDAVDALSFSSDGTQILGTTLTWGQPSTVVLTAPYYDPGSHNPDDATSALWTTSILFPNTSRDCSHAVLLQSSTSTEASWTFTYDRSFETFRAVSIDDLRNGTTYFTGPIPGRTSQARLLPCTLPAASHNGELVSAGFQGKDIWIYGIPEDLDALPVAGVASSEPAGMNRRSSAPSRHSSSRTVEPSPDVRVPRWQVLCDKLRNNFVGGCKIAELSGVSMTKWVEGYRGSTLKERMIVAARGIMPAKSVTEEDTIDFIDGGRLTLIDFDYGFQDGQTTEVIIEVGSREPEALEEEHRDIDAEVAIVRRRTVALRRGIPSVMVPTTPDEDDLPTVPPLPPASRQPAQDDDDPLVPRRIGHTAKPPAPPAAPRQSTSNFLIEAQEALDAPYAHASPRSGTTLRRAATAAALTRRLRPQATAAAPHAQYRRADGRREHPHESDADNWVPPPPPYQKDDPEDLPNFLRHRHIRPLASQDASQPPRPVTSYADVGIWDLAGTHPAVPLPGQPTLRGDGQPSPALALAHQRRSIDSIGRLTTRTRSSVMTNGRPMSSPSTFDDDDIYNASPPPSPRAVALPSSPEDVVGAATAVSNQPATSAASHVASSPSAHPAPAVASSSVNTQLHQPPSLNLDIPVSQPSNISASQDVRPVSVSRSWPLQPQPDPAARTGSQNWPLTAPASTAAAENNLGHGVQSSAWVAEPTTAPADVRVPPGMSAYRGAFWRNSTNIQTLTTTHNPVRQHPSGHPTIPQQPRDETQAATPPAEEPPLIISTAKGVSGGLDGPERSLSSRRDGPRIFAPVPRHPRGNTTPSVLSSSQAGNEFTSSQLPVQQQAAGLFSPSSLPSPAKRAASLKRKNSRAVRSAAKNMADAKKKGWRRSKSQRRRKVQKEAPPPNPLDVTTRNWTEISASQGGFQHDAYPQGDEELNQGRGKGGKCVVM